MKGSAAPAGIAPLLVAGLVLTGCGQEQPTPSGAERIVAVAPNIVETLFALGLGERVVGVGDYVEWPPEAAEKPRIGGLLDPRLEAITALAPDLAVLHGSEAELGRELGRLDVDVLMVPGETLADLERAIAAIAGRTGSEEAGERLVAELRLELQPRPVAAGARVLMVVDRRPGDLSEVYIAGPGTFLDELAGRLGAVNVLADAPARYPLVGLEEILSRRPQIVIELASDPLSPAAREKLKADWRKHLVEEPPCVGVVAGDHVLIAGPRLSRLYQDLGTALSQCARRDA